MNFERDFPDSHTVVLNENYRSTQQILNGANALIKNNRNRICLLYTSFVPFYQSGNGEDELNNHQNQHDKIAVQDINYHEEKIAYNP